jgi:hypothetical protein
MEKTSFREINFKYTFYQLLHIGSLLLILYHYVENNWIKAIGFAAIAIAFKIIAKRYEKVNY